MVGPIVARKMTEAFRPPSHNLYERVKSSKFGLDFRPPVAFDVLCFETVQHMENLNEMLSYRRERPSCRVRTIWPKM